MEDSGKISITGIGHKGLTCIHLAQVRNLCGAAVSTVMNFHLPYNAGSCLTDGGMFSFSMGNLLDGTGLQVRW